MAAAVRTGVYIERMVLEPPVSWLSTSSGRASLSVTCTRSSGTSSSSAMSMPSDVVMPWPTSARAMEKPIVPSSLTTTLIRLAVGAAAMSCRSPRSTSSEISGGEKMLAPAMLAEATRVGAAMRKPRTLRRVNPAPSLPGSSPSVRSGRSLRVVTISSVVRRSVVRRCAGWAAPPSRHPTRPK